MSYWVYLIHNIQNNKVYVGYTNNPKKRWRRHLSDACGADKGAKYYIHKAMVKWGKENFTFTPFQEFNNRQDCKDAEVYWISYFNSTNREFGYNLTPGGEGHDFTPEQCYKVSKAQKGKKLTEEQKQKLSKSRMGKYCGEDNPFYGKTHTEEVKAAKRGENNKQAKLTWKIVGEIREKFATGDYSYTDLGKLYKISRKNIKYIIINKTWINENYTPPIITKNFRGKRKLTEQQVIEIKKLGDEKIHTQASIARRYGVSYNCIRDIWNGTSWSYLFEDENKDKNE